MLFVVTYTYEPEKRNEVLKRRSEKGAGFPPEVKVIGQWSALGGGGGFVVAETKDPKAISITTRAWSDLVKFTVVPVMDTEELMKLVK